MQRWAVVPVAGRLPVAMLALTVSCGPAWRDISSADGRFRIAFPAEPNERVETIQGKAGVVQVHWLGVTPRPWWPRKPMMYLLSYADYPAAMASGDELLTEAADRLTDYLKRELDAAPKTKESSTYKGFPSLELTFERPNETLAKGRVVAVERRAYAIVVVGPQERVNSAREGMTFLSSLEIR